MFREDLDNEEALRWAALERLSTYSRACRGISKDLTGEKKEVGVSELEAQERILVLERLTNFVGDDLEKFFNRMRSRFDRDFSFLFNLWI